jgi:hypothetical protein
VIESAPENPSKPDARSEKRLWQVNRSVLASQPPLEGSTLSRLVCPSDSRRIQVGADELFADAVFAALFKAPKLFPATLVSLLVRLSMHLCLHVPAYLLFRWLIR